MQIIAEFFVLYKKINVSTHKKVFLVNAINYNDRQNVLN